MSDETEHVQCWACAGHGQVGHLIPDECPTCDGKGWVVRYKSGVLAKWQGGPLLGRDTKRDKLKRLSNEQIDAEIRRIEAEWDRHIIAGDHEGGQRLFGASFHALLKERDERKMHSATAVVRLRFLAGESGRKLDAACAEALGWRVSRDPWWNWHEGPVFDPPGDEWCIRKDARNDLPCNEALPHFTAESFERALAEPTP